jgi:hypothetical protein
MILLFSLQLAVIEYGDISSSKMMANLSPNIYHPITGARSLYTDRSDNKQEVLNSLSKGTRKSLRKKGKIIYK